MAKPVLSTGAEMKTHIFTHDSPLELYSVKGPVNPEETKLVASSQGYLSLLEKELLASWMGKDKVIHGIDKLLATAVQNGVSDIHIEPMESGVRFRYRIDGRLYRVLSLSAEVLSATVSRLKILSGMDIAEKRVPQDGRFEAHLNGGKIDFRVSTLPTVYGEKVVIRVLNPKRGIMGMKELGFSYANYCRAAALLRKSYGLLLLCGPTGSGKTTTLYSFLNGLNSLQKNIITLEDPVEYSLAGINQVQVNTRAGLSFANVLKSVLRQDPDVIMVGEIRDKETAQLAVHAALTGHLVLSTLHTNTAEGAVSRLLDMGIEPYLIAAGLEGVVAQRLVRILCRDCCQSYRLSEEMAVYLEIPQQAGKIFFRPGGCFKCGFTGYKGRIALQEIMLSSADFKACFSHGIPDENALKKIVSEKGMSIRDDGIAKARQGVTALEEVLHSINYGG